MSAKMTLEVPLIYPMSDTMQALQLIREKIYGTTLVEYDDSFRANLFGLLQDIEQALDIESDSTILEVRTKKEYHRTYRLLKCYLFGMEKFTYSPKDLSLVFCFVSSLGRSFRKAKRKEKKQKK